MRTYTGKGLVKDEFGTTYDITSYEIHDPEDFRSGVRAPAFARIEADSILLHQLAEKRRQKLFLHFDDGRRLQILVNGDATVSGSGPILPAE